MASAGYSSFDYRRMAEPVTAPEQNEMTRVGPIRSNVQREPSIDERVALVGNSLRLSKCEYNNRLYQSGDPTLCSVLNLMLLSLGGFSIGLVHIYTKGATIPMAISGGSVGGTVCLTCCLPMACDTCTQWRKEKAFNRAVEQLTNEHMLFLETFIPDDAREIVLGYLWPVKQIAYRFRGTEVPPLIERRELKQLFEQRLRPYIDPFPRDESKEDDDD